MIRRLRSRRPSPHSERKDRRWVGQGSSLHHLKELRPGSHGRSEIRIIFAFDPTRAALLLLGGDKAGNWERWYKENIPLAIRLYIDYTSDDEE
ncbi:type II toxin-antitoxin system RelE/ParE family toxin [Nonomuraea sp. NPDC049714]|uniref:type II toxin-antitoxin system RelE/ParE family toxin n=1 Tax=Nonomuraea sp. NPDC049714 TaxID=3364357 RepID=UPI003796B6CB